MTRVLCLAIITLLLPACGNKEAAPGSENSLDAARNFIRAALDRKWTEARRYMLQDSANVGWLNSIEKAVEHENAEDRRGYRDAEITTYDPRPVNDSTTIINYSNTFKNKRDSLRVVRVSGQWLVDPKYSMLSPERNQP